jgi:hypothetical protein
MSLEEIIDEITLTVYAIGRFITPESFCYDFKVHCKFETLETDKDLFLKLLLEADPDPNR